MGRPAVWDDVVRANLEDGRLASHGELMSLGVPKTAISRLVDRGVLSQVSYGTYQLAEFNASSNLSVLAKRYGGQPDRPRGILCLQVAAHVHELTDMGTWNIPRPEVAMPIGSNQYARRTSGVRIIQWRVDYPGSELEWRSFDGCGIHVTSPARTVCDLYSPWASPLGEGMAREALARLAREDIGQARRAVDIAGRMGWADGIDQIGRAHV